MINFCQASIKWLNLLVKICMTLIAWLLRRIFKKYRIMLKINVKQSNKRKMLFKFYKISRNLRNVWIIWLMVNNLMFNLILISIWTWLSNILQLHSPKESMKKKKQLTILIHMTMKLMQLLIIHTLMKKLMLWLITLKIKSILKKNLW